MTVKQKIIIISGPSGVGKSTVVNELLRTRQDLARVITCTTRPPRPYEVDGRDYYFISRDEFIERIKKNEFLEYALVHNHYYGIPQAEIERILKNGQQPVLVIDVQGTLMIKSKLAKDRLKLIFILPESKEELKARIKHRADKMNDKQLSLRLKNADKEMQLAKEYDYRIVNKSEQLNATVAMISQAIDEEIE